MFASAEEEGNKSRFNSYSVRNIAFPQEGGGVSIVFGYLSVTESS